MTNSYNKSKSLYKKASKALAGGVSSQIRLTDMPTPLFFENGSGAKLWDVDGNEYIDYVLGQGPNIFGHAPEFLHKRVTEDIKQGIIFAGQHQLEIDVAESIKDIVPCAELVRFASSGSEVTQAVIRLARAYTGKNKFIKFEGHYHGWIDSVLYGVAPDTDHLGSAAPGSLGLSQGSKEEIIILPWNDSTALEEVIAKQGSEIAAVITEPIMCNTNCILPKPGYLENMRSLCTNNDIILIFDEVITGFRVGLGGAQAYTGVTPDLATYAKAMAGGYPAAMFCGKKEVMSQLEDSSVIHAGTVNSNVISMSAAAETINALQQNNGQMYREMYSMGDELIQGIKDIATTHEINLLIQGLGSVFNTSFTFKPEITNYSEHLKYTDVQTFKKFRANLQDNGVRITARGTWMLSTSHSIDDIEKTLNAVENSIKLL